MATKLIQSSWRSATLVDTARLFGASRFTAASSIHTTSSLTTYRTPADNSPSFTPPPLNLFSALVGTNKSSCLRLPLGVYHESLLYRRTLTTNSTPLRNNAEPKREQNKPVHDPYVMNLTVRESNVIKLGPSDRRQPSSVEGTEKLGLFKRFKALYKQYWYVMLPVHVITSAGWIVGFYHLSKR